MQYHRYLTLFTSGERLEVPEVSMRKTCRSTIKPSSTLQFFLNLYEDNLLFSISFQLDLQLWQHKSQYTGRLIFRTYAIPISSKD